MTYLTKEDWQNTYVQIICDDKSFSDCFQEKMKIFSDFSFLLQKILKTKETFPKKLFQRTLYSSLIFFHKYVIYNGISISTLSLADRLTLYSTCIFLSFKIINKLIDLETISSKFQNLFNEGKNIKYEIEDICELITKKEFEILTSIQFQANIDWPYDYFNLIRDYLTNIEIGNNSIKNIINLINIKINTIIVFPLYLYYTPVEILISALVLIIEEYKLNNVNINELIEMNGLDIDKGNIEECSKLIDKVIKQKKVFDEEKNSDININKTAKDNIAKEEINFNTIPSIQTNN